jgi:hypothetical protein
MVQQRTSSRAPWWVRLIVLVGALLTGAGGVIALANPAMLVGPQPQIGTAAHVFAGYFAARNLVLACVLLLLLAMQAQRALGQLLALVGLIQCADAVLDCVEGRWPIVPGVIVLVLLFLLAASKLCGSPFWRREAWTDVPTES